MFLCRHGGFRPIAISFSGGVCSVVAIGTEWAYRILIRCCHHGNEPRPIAENKHETSLQFLFLLSYFARFFSFCPDNDGKAAFFQNAGIQHVVKY